MNKEQRYQLFGALISWLVGYLGADRFYKGEIALGVIKLVTFGGFGVWWLIDALVWTYRLGKACR